MALAASLPIYDGDRNLVGVVSIDLFFSHLSSYFKSLSFGKTGVGFVIERSGLLVATSTEAKLFTESPSGKERIRIPAVQSSVPVISASAKFLSKEFGGFRSLDKRIFTEFSSEGRRIFLFASPIRDPFGIDWISVVAIPKADFMRQIDASLRSTIILVFAAFLCAILLGIITSKIILRSLTLLVGRTQTLAGGDWGLPLSSSHIEEIDELNISFNRMSEELRKSQESLHEKEERLDLALKGADLGTWDWNVQTGEVLFNARWAEILGYSPNELAPNVDTWKSFLCPEDEAYVNEVLNRHLEGNSPYYETEHRLRAKSGEWVWVLDKGKVTHRDQNGKPLRAVGTHLDITARKNAEESLRGLVEEKDVLLRELQHRVKNTISS